MKRTFTLLFLLLLSVSSFSQISVETLDFIGFTQKLKTERVEKFKSLKTIFILPNIYDQESYNEILKDLLPKNISIQIFKVLLEHDGQILKLLLKSIYA